MIRAAIPLVIILAGCQSDYQRDFAYCSANGSNPNVDQVNACMLYQSNNRLAESNNRRAGMLAASGVLLSQNRQPAPMQPLPRQVQCVQRYNSFLNQVETTCR